MLEIDNKKIDRFRILLDMYHLGTTTEEESEELRVLSKSLNQPELYLCLGHVLSCEERLGLNK
jgi:hypothetical protein